MIEVPDSANLIESLDRKRTLEDLVEERRSDGKDKEIFKKAFNIFIGYKNFKGRMKLEKGLIIDADVDPELDPTRYEVELSIIYNKKTVFQCKGSVYDYTSYPHNIDCFIPGDWETLIDNHYNKKLRRNEEIRKKQKKEYGESVKRGRRRLADKFD